MTKCLLRAEEKMANRSSDDLSLSAEFGRDEPNVSLFPLLIKVEEEQQEGEEEEYKYQVGRSCSVVVSGLINNYDAKTSHSIVTYSVSDSRREELSRLELQEETLSKLDIEDGCTRALFKVKVAGLPLGGLPFELAVLDPSGEKAWFAHVGVSEERRQSISFSTPLLPPSLPLNIRCLSRPTAIKLRWNQPLCDGGNPASEIEYIVERLDRVSGFSQVYKGRSRSCQVDRLRPGSEYVFRICAWSSVSGYGPWSSPILCTTKMKSPSAPGTPYHAPSHQASDSLDIVWDEPSNVSVAPVKRYVLELSKPCLKCQATRQFDTVPECIGYHVFEQVFVGPRNACVIADHIFPATTYFLRVRAENAIGISPFSRVGLVQSLGRAPSPPSPPTAIRIDEAAEEQGKGTERKGPLVEVFWAPPTNDHGSPIKSFSLEIRKRKRSKASSTDYLVAYSGSKSSCTLHCLKPGATYHLRALAQNEYGWSDPSIETILRMDASHPGKPESPLTLSTVDQMTRTAQLAWQPLPDRCKNGAAVQGYAIFARIQPDWFEAELERRKSARSSQTKRLRDQPLVLAKREWIQIKQALESMAEVPDHHVHVGQLYDYFEPHTEQWRVAQAVTSVTNTPEHPLWEITLLGETTETFRVHPLTLVNRMQPGDSCRALNYITNMFEDAIVAQATLTGYEVSFARLCDETQDTLQEHIERRSAFLSITKPSTLPRKGSASDPEPVTEPVGTDEQAIPSEFDAKSVASNGTYSTGSETAEPLLSKAWVEVIRVESHESHSCTVSCLAPGIKYELSYAAYNQRGVGDLADPLQQVCVAPSPPERLTSAKVASINGTTVRLELPVSQSCIDGWHIAVSHATMESIPVPGWEKVAVLEKSFKVVKTVPYRAGRHVKSNDQEVCYAELQLDQFVTSYAVRVRAFGKAGSGEWCRPFCVVTGSTIPNPPKNLSTTKVSQEMATLQWQPPEKDGGSPVTSYEVRVQHGRRGTTVSNSVDSMARSFSIKDCTPGASFTCWVVAHNENGASGVSEPLEITIPCTVPQAPTNLIVVAKGQTWVKCKWTRPGFDGGDSLTAFEVQSVLLDEARVTSFQGESFCLQDTDQPALQSYPSDVSKGQLKGLKPQSSYAVRVRACNSAGQGPFSSWLLVETDVRPLAVPSGLRHTCLQPLRFEWDSVSGSDTTYRVLDGGTGAVIGDASETFFILDSASPGCTYSIKVSAFDPFIGDFGPYSPVYSVTLPASQDCVNDAQKTVGVWTLMVEKWIGTRSVLAEDSCSESGEVEKVDSGKKASKRKLVKASKALKLRRLKWYQRYPKIGILCFSSLVAFMAYLSFVLIAHAHVM